MSSLSIVRGIRTCVQKQLLPAVPKRWHKQFIVGVQAFSLRANSILPIPPLQLIV